MRFPEDILRHPGDILGFPGGISGCLRGSHRRFFISSGDLRCSSRYESSKTWSRRTCTAMSSLRSPSSRRSSSCLKYLARTKRGCQGLWDPRGPPPGTPPSKGHALALDVEVQHADVIDQHGEGAVGQVRGGLPQDLVQHRPVGLWGEGKGVWGCPQVGEPPSWNALRLWSWNALLAAPFLAHTDLKMLRGSKILQIHSP